MSRVIMDANEAVARVAYKVSEVIAIYPITPSSPMGEHSDDYAAKGQPNIFGTVPDVLEMQSEGGASGTVHGALQGGSLSTTFTASQGLLLMIPNMYKIAGELTPTVFHVAARSLAAQALSIFGDHGDVMQCRPTGFTMLASCDAQEAHDFALIAQSATLKGRLPVLHFFDGFRTSHELMDVQTLDDETLRAMVTPEMINEHKARSLDPEHPVLRGTSQNPDVYFQGRETVNRYYDEFAGIVQEEMDTFARLTGRQYRIYEYYGCEKPKQLIVIMASAAKTVKETIDRLNEADYETGVLIVRLYRPFDREKFIASIPSSVEQIAVLDRTKEPGANGEPLYLDVVNAYMEAYSEGQVDRMPKILGGRYGLSSKEFTPSMVKAVYDELKKEKSKNHFTVGIIDDVTMTSLEVTPFTTDDSETTEAMFYGLGSDGTVGANKNSIKIIGESEGRHVQGYFVYDSKKSGSMTVSHLRFSSKPIHSTYLIENADFIGVHQFVFILKYDILKHAKEGASVLLNAPYPADEVWQRLPRIAQERIIGKKLRLYTINAYEVAKECGLGVRINTIMQTCFFSISRVIPVEEALAKIKHSIEKTYGKKGEIIVRKNFCGVDKAIENLHRIEVPDRVSSGADLLPVLKLDRSDMFLEQVTAKIEAYEGDEIPVSQIPADGTWPLGTTKYEKRSISLEAPVWDPEVCIQCGKCAEVCPHAVIRAKVFDESFLEEAPEAFTFTKAKGKTFADEEKFTIKVSVEDCTGCSLCVEMCPAKNKSDLSKKAINMAPIEPTLEQDVKNWDFFLRLPEYDRSKLDHGKVKEAQLLQPLFEFSGACPGCGETPYLKLLSQLFGDRMIVANATGCSSIYGGNLPTTPWSKNDEGKGVAWSNSLFEDNAEFGLGMRASVDRQSAFARELLGRIDALPGDLVEDLLSNEQRDERAIARQRENVARLDKLLETIDSDDAKLLQGVSKYLIRKSVWAIGGDGWAYDIGYGGLDHVLASGKNINILVLDTQVYSNTGGQKSKATPIGAVAKFAAGGKDAEPKDLALHALSYGNVYVARVAMGANDSQTLKALREAEAYDGVSIIIAYSHCIAHGYDLRYGMQQQKKCVESGLWPLMRYNPLKVGTEENPFSLDYKEPKLPVKEYMYNETRFKMVLKMDEDRARHFLEEAQAKARKNWIQYSDLAASGNLTIKKDEL